MTTRFAICLAMLAAGLAGATSLSAVPLRNTPGHFAPRDECARLPGAAAFRAALSAAVRRFDAEAIGALAADDIELDFGGGAGRAELIKRLRAKNGVELWRELGALLVLGCMVEDGSLVLPWFNGADLGEADPFQVLLVAGAGVPLYSRAAASSPPLARLSWQLVKPLADNRLDRPLQHVELVGSRQRGYIARAKLRSQIGYRLVAKRVGRDWRISALIDGD